MRSQDEMMRFHFSWPPPPPPSPSVTSSVAESTKAHTDFGQETET